MDFMLFEVDIEGMLQGYICHGRQVWIRRQASSFREA